MVCYVRSQLIMLLPSRLDGRTALVHWETCPRSVAWTCGRSAGNPVVGAKKRVKIDEISANLVARDRGLSSYQR